MGRIRLLGFSGEIPRAQPTQLPDAGAQYALNARLENGALVPFRRSRLVRRFSEAAPGSIRSIYLHQGEWLRWSSAVNAAPGPVAQDRLYFTGDGEPKMRVAGKVYALALPYPVVSLYGAVLGTPTSTDVTTRVYGFLPGLATSAAYALQFALVEWDKTFLTLSDRNDIRAITKRLNGGYNGYKERVEWFNRIFALLAEDERPAWRTAKPSASTRKLQQQLVALGYKLNVDGKYGPATTDAVIAFQRANGLTVDGIAGRMTLEAIKARTEGLAANPTPATVQDPPKASEALAPGGSAAAIGAVGQEFVDKSRLLEPYAELSTWLQYGCAALLTLGVALLLVGAVRTYVIPAFHKPKAPVAA